MDTAMKYHNPGNSDKITESSNQTSKHSLDNRSKFDNHLNNYTSSYSKHASYNPSNRLPQDFYRRRSVSVESRTRTHSWSPNRKLSTRSTSNYSYRHSSARESSTKTSFLQVPSTFRNGQEKTAPVPQSKPITAKIPEKLPKKLDKDTILKLVNSTTRYEPAMQKLLREQRSKLTQNLRNKYNSNTKDNMATNSTYADEEITDGIIPNFTINLTADLQFLQEALDNVSEKEAEDAVKLSRKIDNDCDKTILDEEKSSNDLILLDEWSATEDKESEELNSYNNYDLGPLEIPSNIEELQLPSDVSSFFNFTEINKEETTSLLNGGGEDDQDFFNTVKIDENSGNLEGNQSTIATTKLSPIKSMLDTTVLRLANDLVENKQEINDQNENLISEISKENCNSENTQNDCSPFKTEIVKNDTIVSYRNSLQSNENYISCDKENDQDKNFENDVSSLKNRNESNQNELKNYELSFINGEKNIPNEHFFQKNYVDKKQSIDCIEEKNDFSPTDAIEEKEKSVSSNLEEKMVINSINSNDPLLLSQKKVISATETNVSSNVVPLENQINPQIKKINSSSKKYTKKSTNQKRVSTRKPTNNKSTIRKLRKEKVKPIRIKLLKKNTSLNHNLNYFRQIIRAEILNTNVASSYEQNKTRKFHSNNNNNMNEQIIESNVRNNLKLNRKFPKRPSITQNENGTMLNVSQNENLQNTDINSINSKRGILTAHTISLEKSSPNTSDICSEKSEHLENTASVLTENSELIPTTDSTNMLADKLTNEDDNRSDNNPDKNCLSKNENNFRSRKWRSPGEKKFISASSTNKRPISSSNNTNGKEEILLKIFDIDVQIQRLMDEKMNLYKQLMAQSEGLENTTKKSVVRKLDLDAGLEIDTAASQRIILDENPITEQSITNGDSRQRLDMEIDNKVQVTNIKTEFESNSPINDENTKICSQIKTETNTVITQTNKRNKHGETKSKIVNRSNDKENVSKRKNKKQENVDKLEIGVKKSPKIVEKNDKIELYDDERLEKFEPKKAQKDDIESKKSPKKSRRERSSSTKRSSKDKHFKETIRSDECDSKKLSVNDHIVKRSAKVSSVTPNSDLEDHKSMKNNSNRIGITDNETYKTKISKRKRDGHESDSKPSIKRHTNKKRMRKYVLSDSEESESQFEKLPSKEIPSPPSSINHAEKIRTLRYSVDARQKSIEHETPMKNINESVMIKPCIVPLIRINPKKYLKRVEDNESETISVHFTESEGVHNAVKIDCGKNEEFNENVVSKQNESNSMMIRLDQDIQNSDETTVSQTTSTICLKNTIKNNDMEFSTNKLDNFKCSDHTGSILYVKTYKNSIIAGGEDGKIYKYSVNNGELLNSVSAHQAAITSFCLINNKGGISCIYTGSLDTYFKCFEVDTLKELRNIQINTAIQCMDADWGYIFIGTVSGHLYRYSINSDVIEDEKHRLGDEAILALKTRREGARRILISAPRNELISIRDAMSGLLLRYLTFTASSYTIYSIMLSQHESIIYCGTNKKLILGYNFIDGLLTKELIAGKGIVCLLEYEQLLFAGCYDGFIYVFDILTDHLVTKFLGPGGMILALDIIENKVIIGSKNSCLEVRKMPEVVLKYIKEHRR